MRIIASRKPRRFWPRNVVSEQLCTTYTCTYFTHKYTKCNDRWWRQKHRERVRYLIKCWLAFPFMEWKLLSIVPEPLPGAGRAAFHGRHFVSATLFSLFSLSFSLSHSYLHLARTRPTSPLKKRAFDFPARLLTLEFRTLHRTRS